MKTGLSIGIAGAGLVGRLLAWQLLRAGQRVTLFDRDVIDGEASAARVAAAMLAPYSELVRGEALVFELGLAGLDVWPVLLEQLHKDSGVSVAFQRRGSVVLAHRADSSSLSHFNQLLRNKLGSDPAVQYLDRAALSELEPTLAKRFDGGTYLAQEACLDNWALLDALAVAILRLGGQWRQSSDVETVAPGLVVAAGEANTFDMAIDARGVGVKPQWPELRGVRGEVLWVRAPEVAISRPVRLMHPRYQLYIAPKPAGVFVIGATEIESESMAPVTVRSSLELLSALYSVDPAFGEAQVLKCYANCRPAFADHLPRIEISDGLLRVNGLYRHGYLLAPEVLRLALAALDTGVCHPVVSDFRARVSRQVL